MIHHRHREPKDQADTAWKKMLLLLGLYIAQSIPMSFFSTVVPVIMRQENYSLEAIGMLQMIKLPWIFKFFWAPLVDKTGQSFRQLRRWIIYSELFYALVIILIGFFKLETDFMLIVVLMIVAFIGSATQDIATDSFAIRILKPAERSIGNSMQSAGSFGGSLIGSGLLLILYHYFGWQVLLVCLAFFVLIAVVPLMFYKPTISASPPKPSKKVSFADIGLFFTQKGAGKRVLLLFFFYSGIIGILTMLKPFMVDLGYSVKEIGFMVGIFGTSTAIVSSFAAGLIMKKVSRLASLLLFSALMALAAGYFWALTLFPVTTTGLYVGIAFLWGSYGMAMVAIFTSSMDFVRTGREGTDFTIQIVLTQLSSLVLAVFSGKIADTFAYKGLFLGETIVALTVVIALTIVFINNKKKVHAKV